MPMFTVEVMSCSPITKDRGVIFRAPCRGADNKDWLVMTKDPMTEPSLDAVVTELRGRLATLEVFISALLYAGLKAGAEGELLLRLVRQGERDLIEARKNAATDAERRTAEFAITQYREIALPLAANLSSKQTKN